MDDVERAFPELSRGSMAYYYRKLREIESKYDKEIGHEKSRKILPLEETEPMGLAPEWGPLS